MRILCVCTGNVCRSPMLEALLRREYEKLGRADVTVHSAGVMTNDGMSPTPEAITAMNEIGLDISEHRSRQVTPAIIDDSDVFAALTTEHGVTLAFYHAADPEKVVVPGAGIPDPYGRPLSAYRACRDELLETLPKLMEDIDAVWNK